MSERIRKAIKEAIREAVAKNGQRAFSESQSTAPVDTGKLKSSGIVINNHDGVLIKYAAEYAEAVERGWAGGKVWTGMHVRGKSVVRGHYKNQPPKEGKHFIENSLRKFFKGDSGSKSPLQQDFFQLLQDKAMPAKVIEE